MLSEFRRGEKKWDWFKIDLQHYFRTVKWREPVPWIPLFFFSCLWWLFHSFKSLTTSWKITISNQQHKVNASGLLKSSPSADLWYTGSDTFGTELVYTGFCYPLCMRQFILMIKSMNSGARPAGVNPCLPFIWLWENYLVYLCLSFLIWKTGTLKIKLLIIH